MYVLRNKFIIIIQQRPKKKTVVMNRPKNSKFVLIAAFCPNLDILSKTVDCYQYWYSDGEMMYKKYWFSINS